MGYDPILHWDFLGVIQNLVKSISTGLDHTVPYWRHYCLLISCKDNQKGQYYDDLIYIYSLTWYIIINCYSESLLWLRLPRLHMTHNLPNDCHQVLIILHMCCVQINWQRSILRVVLNIKVTKLEITCVWKYGILLLTNILKIEQS